MAEIKQTERASKILNLALQCCIDYRHEFIMPEHLLLTLLDESNFHAALNEHVDMVRRAAVRYPNVRVETSDILLAEYAKRYENAVLVKGLRAASDFDYEFQMNLINKKINPDLETMFLTASEKYTFLSSSVVREMAKYQADLTGLVPNELIPDIEAKARTWRKN